MPTSYLIPTSHSVPSTSLGAHLNGSSHFSTARENRKLSPRISTLRHFVKPQRYLLARTVLSSCPLSLVPARHINESQHAEQCLASHLLPTVQNLCVR